MVRVAIPLTLSDKQGEDRATNSLKETFTQSVSLFFHIYYLRSSDVTFISDCGIFASAVIDGQTCMAPISECGSLSTMSTLNS